MPRILIIEDDKEMQFVLSDGLQAEGYETTVAGGGNEGVARSREGNVDLVLLDLMLPDISGIDVCRQIRERNVDLPVIMLTAKTEEIDKVVGLEVGADDYVTKPFSMRELLARIRALLRRAARAQTQTIAEIAIGATTVDFAHRELRRGARSESLTRYEADLLHFLAIHRGNTVSRESILEEVWGAELNSGNRTVDNYVARLRSKLESSPARPQFILTVHGAGYKLV
jgi:DNA-binding response OmpR family regulator